MDFPSTHWSLLTQATLNGDALATTALEEFCRRYRQPIVQFVRHRGVAESDVEDVTHDFLLHLLEKSALRRANAARGRFRSFLLGALVRYLGDVYDRRGALKRGGGQAPLSLDLMAEGAAPATSQAEEATFDRAWATELLASGMRRLEEEYTKNQRVKEYAVLRAYVPGRVQPPSYEESAVALGLSLGALKSEVHRMRKRLRVLVREEVAATVAAPQEIDEEIAYLSRVLAGSFQ